MTELKVLSLNTWGGRVYQPLIDLLRELASRGTHVFCLQEVWDIAPSSGLAHTDPTVRLDLLACLRDALPMYQVRFSVNSVGTVLDGKIVATDVVRYGNALLVRDDVRIEDYHVHPIVAQKHPATGPAAGSAKDLHTLQVARLQLGDRLATVANFHGVPWPGDKLDTSVRLLQSKRLLQVAWDVDVLCGDFNLDPNTRSVALLEGHWRNLIREFDVASTRSRLNPFWGTPHEQRYADYVFVSDAVIADRFYAHEAQVSDHLGLWLEARLAANSSLCPATSLNPAA